MALGIQEQLLAFVTLFGNDSSMVSTETYIFDPGIWAGMHTVRHFDGKTYEWVGLSRQRSIMGKVCSLTIH
jgi:hypothetical protein